MKTVERKEDRRIQKTKGLLYRSLIQLISQKGYDSIIVQDILNHADVCRSTFYAHFRDKDELLISGIYALKDRLSSIQAKSVKADPESLIFFSLELFEHAYEFRPVYKSLLLSQARSIVNNHFQEMLAQLLISNSKIKKGKVPTDLVIKCVASTFMTVFIWWMNSSPKLKPKEVDQMFRALALPILKNT